MREKIRYRTELGITLATAAGLIISANIFLRECPSNSLENAVEQSVSDEDIESSPEPPVRNTENGIPEAPIYDSDEIPSGYCSRYVRFAARDLFDKQYPAANAWDIRDNSNVVVRRINDDGLPELVDKGELKPGDLVGMHNPKSMRNYLRGVKEAGYTHVLLYLGANEEGLHFAHQFGSKMERKTLRKLQEDYSLKPIEVISINEN